MDPLQNAMENVSMECRVLARYVRGWYTMYRNGPVVDWMNDHYEESPARPMDGWWFLMSDTAKKMYLDNEMDNYWKSRGK